MTLIEKLLAVIKHDQVNNALKHVDELQTKHSELRQGLEAAQRRADTLRRLVEHMVEHKENGQLD